MSGPYIAISSQSRLIIRKNPVPSISFMTEILNRAERSFCNAMSGGGFVLSEQWTFINLRLLSFFLFTLWQKCIFAWQPFTTGWPKGIWPQNASDFPLKRISLVVWALYEGIKVPSLSPVSLVRMSRLVAPVIKRLPSAFGQADDADVDGKEHGVSRLSIHLDTTFHFSTCNIHCKPSLLLEFLGYLDP